MLRLVARLTVLLRPYWGRLATGIGLGLVASTVGLLLPLITRMLIDDVFPRRDFELLRTVVWATLVLSLAIGAIGAIRSVFSQVVIEQLGGALGLVFANHVQHLPLRYFEQHRTGDIASRFGDLRRAAQGISQMIETGLTSGLYLLLVPPLLLYLNWPLALLALATIPLTAVLSSTTARTIRRQWQGAAETQAAIAATHIDLVNGIRTIKLCAAEPAMYARIERETTHLLALSARATAMGSGVTVLNASVRAVGTAIFTAFAWTQVLHGGLTLGEFLAFSAYVAYLTGPAQRASMLMSEINRASVSLARVFEVLDHPVDAPPSSIAMGAVVVERGAPLTVECQDVTFSYGDRAVLAAVSLRCAPGSITALVGPSGAGKSSLIRVLAGLDQPSWGEIRVGGIPMHQIPHRELRSRLSVVWQEHGLVSGTIWDNLTLGVAQPTDREVAQCVRLCHFESVIENLSKGYMATVAELGASLSSGERQRLALARAVLRGAPVLILDEATSHVDAETERAILENLASLSPRPTIIYTTHRHGACVHADQVCELRAGRVVSVSTGDAYATRGASRPRLAGALHGREGMAMATENTVCAVGWAGSLAAANGGPHDE